MLLTCLKQLIRTYRHPAPFKKILKDSGCPADQISRFLLEEAASLSHLIELVDKNYPDAELQKQLRNFLRVRWALIRSTSSAYPSFPHSPMNQICLTLAQALVRPEEPLIQVLMPSIEVTDYIIASEDLIELTEIEVQGKRQLAFWNFIISEDGRAVIPLKKWFHAQADNNGEYFNHLYASGSVNPHEQEVRLTAQEISQLRGSALPASDIFFEEFEFRKKLMNSKGTLAEAMIHLCDGLSAHGQSGKGNADSAHHEVFQPIHDFAMILRDLTQAQRESIFMLGDFYTQWQSISGLNWKNRISNTNVCVELASGSFRSILQKYPDIFSSIPIASSANQTGLKPQITAFSKLLENIHYVIKSRERALISFLQEGDLRAGMDGLKLPYPCLSPPDDWLALYSWHLDNPGALITDFRISTHEHMRYIHSYFQQDIFLDYLNRQDAYTLSWCLEWALLHGNETLAESIFCLTQFTLPESTLRTLIEKDDIRLVKAYIRHKHPLDKKMLHYSLRHQKIDIATMLVEAGVLLIEKVHVNSARTLLTYAISKGYVLLAKALIARQDIDLNRSDESGCTALHWAVSKGFTDIVQLLLDKKANPTLITIDGQFPHDLAHHTPEEENIFLLFLESGVHPDQLQHRGRPLLLYSMDNRFLRIKEFILSRQGFREKQLAASWFSAVTQFFYENEHHCKELLRLGVDVNVTDAAGQTALHRVACTRDHRPFDFLRAQGANVFIKDKLGRTPLQVAICFYNNPLVFHMLSSIKYEITRFREELKNIPSIFLDFVMSRIRDSGYIYRIDRKIIRELMAAGGFSVYFTDENFTELGLQFSLSELISHPSLNKWVEHLGFDRLCDLIPVKLESHAALKLYAAMVSHRLPPEASNILRSCISQATGLELWEQLKRQRPYLSKFWTAYDPLQDMPSALKIFANSLQSSKQSVIMLSLQ